MYLKSFTKTNKIQKTFYKCRENDKMEKMTQNKDYNCEMYLIPNINKTKVHWVFYNVVLSEKRFREEKLK